MITRTNILVLIYKYAFQLTKEQGNEPLSAWTTAPEYLSILPKVRLLLLGSYSKSFMQRLESIKSGLIQGGLMNCRITKDFFTPNRMQNEPEQLYNLRKSEYWVRQADVLFFIFFSGTDNASVALELSETLSQIPGNAWRTILAHEENVPSLIAGIGIRFQPEISLIPFSDDEDLQKQAIGNIVRLLDRLYPIILIRPDGEWECSSI